LKSLSAKRLIDLTPQNFFLNGEENQVWQESFKATPLWSAWMIWQKINYIHSNPLNAKWKLAAEPQHYKFSSAKFYYEGIDEWGFLENYLNVS